ncbi:unnamed protein product [Phytophthora lilii]|uniref:Unnamed protein product n=1 Tax=Phytophthora lilii TaxID=2077276 RepID=A0A9W6U8J2_9STRA|nr:unnamed protein product [Phytophthora lilii]
MKHFPTLLEHPMVEFNSIMERDAYTVIFARMVKYAKYCFEFPLTTANDSDEHRESGKGSNVVVTGNPGTGKSRFLLYCMFQLTLGEQEDVQQLPLYELVVNHNEKYVKYDAATKEFVDLDKADVSALMGQRHVLRLVEATSSELTGWSGVSVLFASPGVEGYENFEKVDGLTFTMPTWILEELKEYNTLLSDRLKLDDDELLSRYDLYGGIPRFVFSQTIDRPEAKIHSAITSFDALKVISYCRSNAAVRENDYSNCVLQMVPTQADYCGKFYLDFVSMHIAEKIIDKVHGDSLNKVSEFAVVHDVDHSGSTAVVRGRVYELLSHKQFSLHMVRTLQLRSLGPTAVPVERLTIPDNMETVRFAAFDQLKLARNWTYYRPTSRTFGALDAFIWDGNSACYGLQMTVNADHGIKAAPLNKFLKWLNDQGVPSLKFSFIFLVPSNLEASFRKQSTRTATGAVSKTPGASGKVGQFVAALDLSFAMHHEPASSA